MDWLIRAFIGGSLAWLLAYIGISISTQPIEFFLILGISSIILELLIAAADV